MTMLTDIQKRRAIEVLQEWVEAPTNGDGKSPRELQEQLDLDRVTRIEEQLKPLVNQYLVGQIPLAEFKSAVDGINKRHEYWGFKGIKGQMFFNMLVNVAGDAEECDAELKSLIACPDSEPAAKSRLRNFTSYVRRVGEDFVEAGGSKHGRPKLGSIPFFASYFWQVLSRDLWPVYYTNSAKTMGDLNLWEPSEDEAENYILFKHIHEELQEVFSETTGTTFSLYDVEHVFWFKGGNQYGGATPQRSSSGAEQESTETASSKVSDEERPNAPASSDTSALTRLPTSYVPPIIAVLPRMARHDEAVSAAAKASGTTIDRAFEVHTNVAFTLLGYETKLLGQGQGRVPDGRAIARDELYGILWDAKVRQAGYSMGTDDRTILTQGRILRREFRLNNLYYALISSGYRNDHDESIRMLKMETDISEVCLVEASALVEMVDAKLRDPSEVALGPDGLQRLFANSGIITAEDVRALYS